MDVGSRSMDWKHGLLPETQEERDLDLKAHVSVTFAHGDTSPDNRPGSVIVKDCGLDSITEMPTEGKNEEPVLPARARRPPITLRKTSIWGPQRAKKDRMKQITRMIKPQKSMAAAALPHAVREKK